MLRQRIAFFGLLALAGCGGDESTSREPAGRDRDGQVDEQADASTRNPDAGTDAQAGDRDSGAGGSGGAAGAAGASGSAAGSGGTGGTGGTAGSPGDDCPAAPPTFDNFADAFFAMNCRSCHAESRTGTARFGAPAGVDFDAEADVVRLRDRIRTAVIVEKRMPPGRTLSDCSIARLDDYLTSLPDPDCQPSCDGKQCGDNGCGGSCGDCEDGSQCESGQCVAEPCEPQCAADSCGDDGCGGACSCEANEMCTAEKQCTCVPNCDGKSCGANGCGGTCGPCRASEMCSPQGACVCVPDCQGKECGDDGCGGSCDTCPLGLVCNSQTGTCDSTCTANCQGRECGSDGCGGSCGPCAAPATCNGAGQCECTPSCAGNTCGSDGCGGTCSCASGTTCNGSGQCIPVCSPNCTGRMCGDNGCGGSCGTCPGGQTCGGDGTCSAPAVDFATSVYPIFAAAGCGTSSCHGGSAPARGLNLSSAGVALTNLVSVPADQCGERLRVAPGAPDSSYLINKLTGVNMCSGERMPRGGSALPAGQINTVRAWISGLP